MSAAIILADAIAALVDEKRGVGYNYDTEARVLARFQAFTRTEFPELDTLTEASVSAWITAARQRGVKPAATICTATCRATGCSLPSARVADSRGGYLRC